jgi:hypothetical protein
MQGDINIVTDVLQNKNFLPMENLFTLPNSGKNSAEA